MLPQIYAILDVDFCARRQLDPDTLFDSWLADGIRLIQLRAKSLGSGEFLALATRLAGRARAAGATFIVNDRADLAALSGADGVHVGQDDLTPRQARGVVGQSAIVGLSTHTDDQVRAALAQPVTYIAIGPVFETSSKERPDAVVGLAGVRRAAALAGQVPVVAIGGITRDRASEVIAAGATSVAMISGVTP